MFCLSKSFLLVIRRFLCSYPLQMTCGGDVHYSADRCLKGSVSEANCCCVGLWSTSGFVGDDTLYSGTQGLPIWFVGDSCQCWWLHQTKQHHFQSSPGKKLWRSWHVSILSASFLCAKGTCFYAVTFENLAGEGHVDPGSIQPLLSGVNGKKAGLTRCSSLVTVEKLSFIQSLCYYFSVSITWLSW